MEEKKEEEKEGDGGRIRQVGYGSIDILSIIKLLVCLSVCLCVCLSAYLFLSI